MTEEDSFLSTMMLPQEIPCACCVHLANNRQASLLEVEGLMQETERSLARGPLTFRIALEGTLTLSPVGEIGISFKRQLAEEKPPAREPVQLSGSKLGDSISAVSRSTLYQEIKSGALIARKIAGRRTVILRADLDDGSREPERPKSA